MIHAEKLIPYRKLRMHQRDATFFVHRVMNLAAKQVRDRFAMLVKKYKVDRGDLETQRNLSHEARVKVIFPDESITLNGSLYRFPMVDIENHGHFSFREGTWPDVQDVQDVKAGSKGWVYPDVMTYEPHMKPVGIVNYAKMNVTLKTGFRQEETFTIIDSESEIRGGRWSIAGDSTLFLFAGLSNNLTIKDTHMHGTSFSGGWKVTALGFIPLLHVTDMTRVFRFPCSTSFDKHSGSTDLIVRNNFFEHFKYGIWGALYKNPFITGNNFGDTLHPVRALSAEDLTFTNNESTSLDDNHPILGTVLTGTFTRLAVENNHFRNYSRGFIGRGSGYIHTKGFSQDRMNLIVDSRWTPPNTDLRMWASIPKGANIGGSWKGESEIEFI